MENINYNTPFEKNIRSKENNDKLLELVWENKIKVIILAQKSWCGRCG